MVRLSTCETIFLEIFCPYNVNRVDSLISQPFLIVLYILHLGAVLLKLNKNLNMKSSIKFN
jgi:hypothetical protein